MVESKIYLKCCSYTVYKVFFKISKHILLTFEFKWRNVISLNKNLISHTNCWNHVTLTSRSNACNFLSHIIGKCEFHVFHLNNFHLLIIIDIKPDAWRKKYTFIICRQIKNNPLHLKRHHHSSNGSFLIMYHLHTSYTKCTQHKLFIY